MDVCHDMKLPISIKYQQRTSDYAEISQVHTMMVNFQLLQATFMRMT